MRALVAMLAGSLLAACASQPPKPIPKPVSEPTLKPVAEPSPKPVAEPSPKPVAEPRNRRVEISVR